MKNTPKLLMFICFLPHTKSHPELQNPWLTKDRISSSLAGGYPCVTVHYSIMAQQQADLAAG